MSGDSGLSQNNGQQILSNVAAMRIGNRNLQLALPHHLVRSAGCGTCESSAPHGPNQFAPLYASEARHQAALFEECFFRDFGRTLLETKSIPFTTGRSVSL
jgi:hypothetical protein